MRRWLLCCVLATGCAGKLGARAAGAPACNQVCTDHELALAGNLVLTGDDAERCICEVRPATAERALTAGAITARR